MILSPRIALLALVSVAAAQSSTPEATTSGSSSSTADSTVSIPSSSQPSSAASTHASSTPSANATSSGSTSLPSNAPPGLTPCILNCVTTAAQQNGCSSFADLSCVCTSKAFQSAATSCLKANCTPADVTTATNLQMTECAAIVGSSGASGAPSNTRSNTASGGGGGTPTAPASTGASSAGPAATTNNSAQISAASSIWALVAGLMGITAVAL